MEAKELLIKGLVWILLIGLGLFAVFDHRAFLAVLFILVCLPFILVAWMFKKIIGLFKN